jgi:sulfite reductase beta subunit
MSGQRGAAVVVGGVGSNTGRGPRLARLLVPFLAVASQVAADPLLDLIGRVIACWRSEADTGERLGDYVERIGWPAFMRKVGVAFDPAIVDDFAPGSIRRNLQMRW